MKLSLVIPCFNESENIPLLLERCRSVIQDGGTEVILVDNGSTDGTQAVLERMLPNFSGCRCVHLDVNQGYGYGILAGLRAARGDILGWTHADLQTDPQDVLAGLAFFGADPDLVFVKGRRYGRPTMDVLFTAGMSFFETLLLAKPMWDINAQPTLFSRRFFETWGSPPNDFGLDLYAYYQACVQGQAIHRFPVRFGPRAYGISHWNVNWAAKWKFIRRTVEFSVDLKRKLSK